MLFFEDFDEQDSSDLCYGEQADLCQQLLGSESGFREASITGDWTVETD